MRQVIETDCRMPVVICSLFIVTVSVIYPSRASPTPCRFYSPICAIENAGQQANSDPCAVCGAFFKVPLDGGYLVRRPVLGP